MILTCLYGVTIKRYLLQLHTFLDDFGLFHFTVSNGFEKYKFTAYRVALRLVTVSDDDINIWSCAYLIFRVTKAFVLLILTAGTLVAV